DASPMVVGSGSGKEVVGSGSGKEVVGSGSGSSGEVVGSGSGSSGEVVGSGSGSSGEGQSACEAMGVWGFAEVVVDADGVHIVVHKFGEEGLQEFMVASFGGNGADLSAGRAEFVMTP
ncbi:MAG: hypothetical protein ACOCSR_03205, partial [Wenzhouxiangella sp.]